MKVIPFILISLSLLGEMASKSIKRRITTQFPQVHIIDSISASEELIVAYIDFDYQELLDSVETSDQPYNRARNMYFSRKEMATNYKQMNDSLKRKFSSFKDYLYLDTLSEEKGIKSFLDEEKASFKESLVFNTFANKPYFEDAPKIKRLDFEKEIKTRNKGIRECVTLITGLDSLTNIPNETSTDTIDNRLPIALFLGKYGDSYCWIYIVNWERKSFDQFADEMATLLDDDEADEFGIKESVKYVSLGHIEGRVYNFDFTRELLWFRCM